MPERQSDGTFPLEIRNKVTKCRELLQRGDVYHVGELADACAELFAIQDNDLPHHLRYDLARARESLFGNALTAEADAEIAEEQFHRAFATLSQIERMHFTQALFAFCDRFENYR